MKNSTQNPPANPHKGHRNRLRSEFIASGGRDFSDIRILELLLFYCIPQKDTNPSAHALLSRFQSFENLLQASVEELCQVPGIKENSAALIKVVLEINRRAAQHTPNRLTTLQEIVAFLQPRFAGKAEEQLYLLCLGSRGEVLRFDSIATGNSTSVLVNYKRLVQCAAYSNCHAAVIAHNHPAGNLQPSPEDIACTLKIKRLLGDMGVLLQDHIIFSNHHYLSLKEGGYFTPISPAEPY